LIILLPPSEGKRVGGGGSWAVDSGRFGGELVDARRGVAGALAHCTASQLKVGKTAAGRALDANSSLVGAPTLPARLRYQGVVYRAIDHDTLTLEQQERASEQIVIVSGLGGLVGYDDPLPDYRASFSTQLGEFGTVACYWSKRLPAVFDTLGERGGPVVDLLPQTHRHALRSSCAPRLLVDLYGPNDQRGGHDAKSAKGVLVRALLIHGVSALDRWSHGEWSCRVVQS
jgi:cytoplasmic iron level regulating protein YaaA (DUF328/UPF0246 family)